MVLAAALGSLLVRASCRVLSEGEVDMCRRKHMYRRKTGEAAPVQ
jgi:hypothetical protein